MAERNEDIQEEEEVEETVDVIEEATDETDWEAKAKELQGINKRLQTKLKKSGEKKEAEPNKTKQSDDFDYGQKAYLVAKGVEGKEEQAFTKSFMEESGKDLEGALDSQYFQTKLKAMREKQATKDATPTNSKRSSSSGRDSVEYWMNRTEQAPTLEMRQKVVNARIAKAQGANTSSGPAVVGGNITGIEVR